MRRCGIRCTIPINSVNIRKRFRKKMCESILDPEHSIGIVEINGEGNAWRIAWGLEGGAEIALATSELMKKYDAAVWEHHGLFCSGPDFGVINEEFLD